MSIWVGSPHRICTGDEAAEALKNVNDSRYYDEVNGITQVDQERWQEAQQFEESGWIQCWSSMTDDRAEEHATIFDNYKTLPHDLGRVLEIGCGPFTQVKRILHGRTATSIMLTDPLINAYLDHMANCTYRQPLHGILTIIQAAPAEALVDTDFFDTIVCINVLEHVFDADAVLHNIRLALKVGGIVVMGERTYDDFDPHQHYDVGHPIRIKSIVLKRFMEDFEILYQNGDYFIAKKVR